MLKGTLRKVLQAIGRFHFIRFGIRDRIIRLMDNPDKGHNEHFQQTFYNLVYEGNFNTFIDWSVFYYGSYTPHELQLIRDLAVFEHSTFVDIGANVGHHSLFASSLFDRVIAVEPFEHVYKKLKQKIAANNLQNVKLLTIGLGRKSELLLFYPPQSENTGTGSFLEERQSSVPIQLQVKNGDEVFAEEGITGKTVIKIDTEGFEPLVLEGLKNYIIEHKPIIFFEWSQEKSGGEKRDQLPEAVLREYAFYEFLGHIPLLTFFERKSYRLRRLAQSWPEGMILAVHNDDISSSPIGDFIKSKLIAA